MNFCIAYLDFCPFHHLYAITPIIANGVNIRYKMPLFKPNAGFSPNCDAVFVHIEH